MSGNNPASRPNSRWRSTWRVSRFVILVLLLTIPAAADWKVPRESLDRRVVHDDIRIHYTLNGEGAFAAGVAAGERELAAVAKIDALVAQLERADRFYRERLGLTPPLDGDRYWNQGVRSIDIHILQLERKTGSAGDEPILYRYRHFAGSEPALTITLSNNWQESSLTPSHELFHSYQYGYTYFKNAWFLEGMARSMEGAFRPGKVVRTEPLPSDPTQLQALLASSYRADRFWNRLFLLCDPKCAEVALRDDAYLPSSEAEFCGGDLLRTILEQLRVADREAARAFGIKADAWPEAEQRAERNNPYLFSGLRRAMDRQCEALRGNRELQKFYQLLRQSEPKQKTADNKQ